jgi:hypothetical protein
MKTKSIATLLTAALTIAFAASASAAPPGKGTSLGASFKKSDAPKVERKIEHNSMKRVGPPGKGYICNR